MPPVLARRVVYPLHEQVMRRPTFAYLASLERTQWLPREELEALQLRKLQVLLATALAHSPWHADRIRAAGMAGLSATGDGDPLTVQDLRRLPTMSKGDARDNMARIHWPGAPGGTFRYNTGGSSGEPLIFYYGRQRQASDAAGRIRARRWWGVDVGDPEVYLWGAPVELARTDRVKTLRDRLLNQLVLNAFEMTPESMDGYLDAIAAFRPRCIYGYASSIALLAAHALDRKVQPHTPELRVVCTTGEPLYPYQRSLIRRVFGVPAANEFGSRDIGFTAHETADGEILLMSESIILEILDPDGHPVPPGEIGEAVMTGLCSEAQPFIRYRTGDLVRAGGEGALDGRGLHVLREVVGRTTDFVVRSDGATMHALAVIYVLRAIQGIAEFKFVQHDLGHVEVLVVPAATWSDEARKTLVTGLQQRLGADVEVAVRLVEAIQAEPSGKYRYVVSHVQSRATAVLEAVAAG
ncbi:MAG: phenylacetate--CoA ligase family protein [Casimicrobiaceae bacterium]